MKTYLALVFLTAAHAVQGATIAQRSLQGDILEKLVREVDLIRLDVAIIKNDVKMLQANQEDIKETILMFDTVQTDVKTEVLNNRPALASLKQEVTKLSNMFSCKDDTCSADSSKYFVFTRGVIIGAKVLACDYGEGILAVGAPSYYNQGSCPSGDGSVVFGRANTASGYHSSVLGGSRNTASGYASSVLGGYSSIASGDTSVIAGGSGSRASGKGSLVAGGGANYASGTYSLVAGGSLKEATSKYSSVFGSSDLSNNHPSVRTGKVDTSDGESVKNDSNDSVSTV